MCYYIYSSGQSNQISSSESGSHCPSSVIRLNQGILNVLHGDGNTSSTESSLSCVYLQSSTFHLKKIYLLIFILCAWVFICMYLCAWCPKKPEESVVLSSTGFTDGCERLCGCWESNSGPLKEEQILLTTEPLSLQSPKFYFNK